MAQHADDLAALLDALGVSRAHVLGISYGGEVSQAFALRHRERVLSLVLADTVSEVGPELRLVVEGWRAAALSGDADLFYLVTAPWNFSPRSSRGTGPCWPRRERVTGPSTCRPWPGSATRSWTWTSRRGSAQLDVPACIIVGDRDLLKGPRYAQILHGAMRGSRYARARGRGPRRIVGGPGRVQSSRPRIPGDGARGLPSLRDIDGKPPGHIRDRHRSGAWTIPA